MTLHIILDSIQICSLFCLCAQFYCFYGDQLTTSMHATPAVFLMSIMQSKNYIPFSLHFINFHMPTISTWIHDDCRKEC